MTPSVASLRIVLLAAAILAAESGPVDAQISLTGSVTDVCPFIDDTDAETALGGAVERNRNPQSMLAGGCAWRSLVVPGDALTVQVDEGGREKFDFDKDRLPVTPLEGVGDEAFAFVSPAGFVQLGMMKSGVYVTIVLQLQNSSDRLAKAEALAKRIADQL